MKKIIALMMVFVLSISMLAGCGGGNAENETADGVKILLTLSSNDTFRQNLVDAAESTAKSLGAASFDIRDSEGSLENQLSHIREAVSGGYDVILCNPVDIDTTLQLQLEAGELPIVFFNSCPAEERLEKGKYVFAGSNEEDAGKYQAEYILEKYKDKDTLNVAIFEGQKLHPASLGRTNALKSALRKSGKTINFVFDDYADWDTELAAKEFETFLKTGQDVDVVACNNDSMALGVIQVCEEKNLDFKNITILGVDATADGCKAIEDGKMQFTVCQSATGQGEYAVKAAANLAKGKSLKGLNYLSGDEKYVWVPFEKVDSSNVKEYE
ncbi:MAG: sugar ABC transporter substrate-binding protein [Lachnospiraceae bacterium]|nr:sugar ABC transporter substrate-binding protein [Lachnospiraceae bacterium]